ncbi:MAG: hypothetical protein LJE70_14795 [Chromatiaceae bacterium]|nr:hypothetical protein [Chromatiaceae bacterium]
MRLKNLVKAAVLVFSAAAAPLPVKGLDLSFLGQAPLRFFNDVDLKLMSDASDQALDKAKDGEAVDWSNDTTGNSGTITPIRDFTRQGNECRRLEVVNRAAKATRGGASTQVDFCNVDGSWKILSVVR